MRAEGTDGMYAVKQAIEQREIERRIQSMHQFMKIPNPGERRDPKKANRKFLTKLPSLNIIRTPMSDKLRQRLSIDSDSFMETIGQKLLSLSTYHYLPELRDRQHLHDKAGNSEMQLVRISS